MRKLLLSLFALFIIVGETQAMRYLCTIFIGSVGKSGLSLGGNSFGWGNCKDGNGICVTSMANSGDEKNSDYIEMGNLNDDIAIIALSKSIHSKDELSKYVNESGAFEHLDDSFINPDVIEKLGIQTNSNVVIPAGEYKVTDDESYFYITVKILSK